MRLLIRLRSLEDSKYEMQYHYHLQGFIYNLLKDSKYNYLHDKQGYKFFCFSNIFPAYDLKRGDMRTLIISSPDEDFVEHIYMTLSDRLRVKVGCMNFGIQSLEIVNISIPLSSPFSLITGTPIIVRIPRENYEQYKIRPKQNYEYIYWKSEYPIMPFALQLENNLVHRYLEYSGCHIQDEKMSNQIQFTLFQKCLFKKQISTKIFMKGTEQTVIGSIWKFDFEGCENKNLIQFAIDAGLGERNSLGFGFMNLSS